MGKHRRAVAFLSLCCLAAGCNRNGAGVLGGSSATGESADQDTQKPVEQPKKGGQPNAQFTEPQNAVDGRPSAASDNGSASTVAHHSVAQPGAPQGTVPGERAAPPSKDASPRQ